MGNRKGVFQLILFIVLAMAIFQAIGSMRSEPPQVVAYSQFKQLVEGGEVTSVVFFDDTNTLEAQDKNGIKITTTFPEDARVTELLEKHKVKIEVRVKERGAGDIFVGILASLLPMVILLFVFMWFMRRMAGGGGAMNAFQSSQAKLFSEYTRKTTFADVAGIPEVKEELQEIIDFLRDPGKYIKLGAKIPRGVLLVGGPGGGKTLLARAVAGEAGVPFFYTSGSSFIQMFVGVGAARVRDMFEDAKKKAPCIIFIDEIDGIGRARGGPSVGGAHDERESTLNQILTEMDGFEHDKGVIVIGATNRPDVLDVALLRPGRFDRRIVVPMPDVIERLEILKVHTRNKPLDPNVDLLRIAKNTPGFSGADLENLANEAALITARWNKDMIGNDEFEAAKDRVVVGLARKRKGMTARDREILMHHEAGHAIVALCTPDAPRPHKVTIIPRGIAGGFTEPLHEERLVAERKSILAQIKFALGGRAAEELFCSTETSGASDDLSRATKLARKMVFEWGMGKATGLVAHVDENRDNFLGYDMSGRAMSEETRRELDREVRTIINTCYEETKQTLEANRDKVEKLAALLDEHETVVLADVPEFKPFFSK